MNCPEKDTEWKNAVIDELVTCGIYSSEHDTNPRKAIADAIAWNVEVALDPKVSLEAKALIERGRLWSIYSTP